MTIPSETSPFEPAYLRLVENGNLAARAAEAYHRMEKCEMCAVRCRSNRFSGKPGGCRIGEQARVSSYGPHMGEEPVLTGWRGSGTIFFSGCNLRCQYCQNYDISQATTGEEVEIEDLAQMMLELQAMGCHNINLVSPSHVVPQILGAVLVAAKAGLRLPLVYNTGGYDALTSLQLLDGIIDIYMPDMKYSNAQVARRYSRIINYPQINRDNVREMHRQVGDLKVDEHGLARRGLMVRHLVLPNGLAGTEEITCFLANEISPDTYVNIMDQYHPAYEAHLHPSLNRAIKPQEFQEAIEFAHIAGLRRIA